MKDVGGRGWWLSGGWLLGVLVCVLVAIPVGVLEAGAGPSMDWTRAIVPLGLMISTGGILGQGFARYHTTVREARGRLLRSGLWWGVGGLIVGQGVAVAMLLLQPGPLQPRHLVLAAYFLVLLTLKGAGTGLTFAGGGVDEDEQRVQDAMRAGLDARRAELESAIERRFGPMDEATADKVRGWDEGRMAEAARPLPEAASLEELGG